MVRNGRFFRDWKSLLVKVFRRNKCLQGLSILWGGGFLLLLVNKTSVTLKRVCQRCNGNWEKEIVSLKTMYLYKILVLESAQKKKNAGRNLNADVVLSRSRGSPDQWFPETDYLCASAIFDVGTRGIPPKLNYRSVKSYTLSNVKPTYSPGAVEETNCFSADR